MKKIINRPENFVDECLDAIHMAYGDRLCIAGPDSRIVLRAEPKEPGKVAIVTAGGSGHLPVFLGYVGEGMLDGCAVGNVFASPSAENIATMIREADTGAGVCKKTNCRKAKKIKQVKILWKKQRPTILMAGRSL